MATQSLPSKCLDHTPPHSPPILNPPSFPYHSLIVPFGTDLFSPASMQTHPGVDIVFRRKKAFVCVFPATRQGGGKVGIYLSMTIQFVGDQGNVVM